MPVYIVLSWRYWTLKKYRSTVTIMSGIFILIWFIKHFDSLYINKNILYYTLISDQFSCQKWHKIFGMIWNAIYWGILQYNRLGLRVHVAPSSGSFHCLPNGLIAESMEEEVKHDRSLGTCTAHCALHTVYCTVPNVHILCANTFSGWAWHQKAWPDLVGNNRVHGRW